MDDRTFDEQTARRWIQGVECASHRTREMDIYPRLSAWVERVAPANLLEIGCGQGACSDQLGLSGCQYIGMDPSPFLIRRANELYQSPDREFLCGNAYALPFGSHAFDAVFSVMVWHLLSDIKTAAREMTRVLAPGGHFLVITANPRAYAEWAAFYTNTKTEGRRFEGDFQADGETFDRDVLFLHTIDEILGVLRDAGLTVDSGESFRKTQDLEQQELLLAIEGTRSRRTD